MRGRLTGVSVSADWWQTSFGAETLLRAKQPSKRHYRSIEVVCVGRRTRLARKYACVCFFIVLCCCIATVLFLSAPCFYASDPAHKLCMRNYSLRLFLEFATILSVYHDGTQAWYIWERPIASPLSNASICILLESGRRWRECRKDSPAIVGCKAWEKVLKKRSSSHCNNNRRWFLLLSLTIASERSKPLYAHLLRFWPTTKWLWPI